jgi:hypothetical protein
MAPEDGQEADSYLKPLATLPIKEGTVGCRTYPVPKHFQLGGLLSLFSDFASSAGYRARRRGLHRTGYVAEHAGGTVCRSSNCQVAALS